MGLVSARAARAAWARRRPACDQLTSTWAALRGRRRGPPAARGGRLDQDGALGLQLVGLGGQELDALGGGPQGAHGGLVLQRSGRPGPQAGAMLDLVGGVAAA